jgi:hypothetical protein
MSNWDGVTGWSAVGRMVEAAGSHLEVQRRSLTSVLEASSAQLAPLGDPLLVDFGAHRWLRQEREEAYSDWLAWIIEQLPRAEVFGLLGIDPIGVGEIGDARPEAKREVRIRGGTRRLDILIRFGTADLIVVEVKTGRAEDAATEKQMDYTAEADKRHISHKVLLITEAQEPDYRGFKPRRWAEVCTELRRSAQLALRQERTVVAAMILAFVGAVEENLLGFTAPKAWTEGAFFQAWANTEKHLRRTLGQEDAMESREETTELEGRRNEVIRVGMSLYTEVLAAVNDFESLAIERCRESLGSSLDGLGKAAGVSLDPASIKSYRIPDGVEEARKWGRNHWWLGAKIGVQGYTICCGLCWDPGIPKSSAYVVAAIELPNMRSRDLAREMFEKAGWAGRFKQSDQPELWFYEVIGSTQASSLSGKLTGLVEEWAKALGAVGGVRALQQLDQSSMV